MILVISGAIGNSQMKNWNFLAPPHSLPMPSTCKWFTCTPVRFKGDHTFFSRDSGLLCKGFQEIGVVCKAIMPGPPMDGDQTEDLIRTDYKNLENPEWWKSLGGDGVVFYGWGSGKYLKIVRAIKQAGLLLVSHMDTSGTLGILNGISEFTGALWRISRGERGKGPYGLLYFAVHLVYAASLSLLRNDWPRSKHLKNADIIGTVSPIAVERIRKVCRIYGSRSLADHVHLIPHPVAPYMKFLPEVLKERLLVAVGRWCDAQKDCNLLLLTARGVLALDQQVSLEIYGAMPPLMEVWHRDLPVGIRTRIHLKGIVPNVELRLAMQRARILVCTSLYESFHIAAAEALCCGCSVVGPDVPEFPSLKWFAADDYGRMSSRDSGSLIGAIGEEIAAWDRSERSPEHIAGHWCQLLHAPRVAERILHLAVARNCP